MKPIQLTFLRRLGSTLTLWAVILAGIFAGYEIGFFILIAGLGLMALWEYFKMLGDARIPHFRLTGMWTGALFMTGGFLFCRQSGGAGYEFETAALAGFLIIAFARQMFERARERESLEAIAYTVFGLLYIPWLFNFITKIVFLLPPLANGQPVGQYYVLYLLLVTKFSDMGAYVFGMLFGKHPFAPHISPKKTWEGFAGALFTAMLGSFGLYFLMPQKLAAFSLTDVAILGLLLGFAAVAGDLAESIVKRSTNAKDSSHLLPGIGGTLDLIDSLLFTAPILFFYMRLVMGIGS
ncbi:MAG TPA: phosphatidate cytidylyltransferase [Chthoniobacterales bacterium]